MADLEHLSLRDLATPAFIWDESVLRSSCAKWNELCKNLQIRQYFPLKCNNLDGPLRIVREYVQGFAASSLFEAQLATELVGANGSVQFTSPAIHPDELEGLLRLCDAIAFNSLSQWERSRERALANVSCGLRVNPQISLVDDSRYDPCRQNSRLGVPLGTLSSAESSKRGTLYGIEGLHFHTNCDSTSWAPLLATVRHLDASIPALLKQCRWINVGGGYLLPRSSDLTPFTQAVDLLRNKYDLDVIVEPGAGVIREACYLIAEVVDLFDSDGVSIAVLNTSVNHMPEVFEYQFSPDIEGDVLSGEHCYLLAGSTCLAGDIFGKYSFDKTLGVGSRVVFRDMGAYTLVKSHMFNGVNLPTVYGLTADGELVLQSHYNYEHFRRRGETHKNEALRNVSADISRSFEHESV